MKNWIWRQISLDLPDEWELLQFGRDRQAGRCAFADRYRFRCEMNWRTVDGQPDFKRMMGDYKAKLEQDGLKQAQEYRREPWYGVLGENEPGFISHYGRYFSEGSCLLELVFLWPRDRDSKLERQILESVRYVPEKAGAVHWRAFDMDFWTDSRLELIRCEALPANVELVFRSKRRRIEQRFARRGMVQEWLAVPIENWLEAWIPYGFKVVDTSTEQRRSHRIVRVGGTCVRTVKDILWGRGKITAAAWLCPRDGRLYSVSSLFGKRDVSQAGKVRLSCCSMVEVKL